MIRVHGLSKSYGARPALRGVALTIAAGERVAIVGPNGSGKTTLLRCLLGLASFEGEITVAGHHPLREHAAAQKHVAYVPQRAPAMPAPVGEIARFWAAERGGDVAALVGACRRLGLDVESVWKERFPSLSGGMQQKLLAGMALATSCPVLMLDEPTANLDPAARTAFFEALADRSPTLLLSSHRLDEVRHLVNRVLVFVEGRLALDADVETFLADPALAAAAGLDFRRSA